MITLTRLDGKPVVVNEDLIVFVEHTPDSLLLMSTGQRLMVKEALQEIVRQSAEFRRQATAVALPPGAAVVALEGNDHG